MYISYYGICKSIFVAIHFKSIILITYRVFLLLNNKIYFKQSEIFIIVAKNNHKILLFYVFKMSKNSRIKNQVH